MNKDIKAAPKKPKLSVPNTQVSLADNQSSTNYLVISGIIVGLILLVGGYFIWTLTTTYLEQTNKIKALDKQIGYLEDKKDNLETVNNGPLKEIQRVRDGAKISDAELIMRALPMTPDQKNLYAMMEQMAKEANVKMQDIKQNDQTTASTAPAEAAPSSTESQTPKTIIFTVTIVGPYRSLLDFLANTEKSARVINFQKMKLEGDSNSVKASIDFTSYYQDKANISDREEDLK